MSSYPYPAAAPPQAATSGDPTAVIGRRIGAWVVDFLLYALIMAFVGPTPLSPLAEYYDTSNLPGVDCSVVQDANDVSSCVEFGDRLYFTEGTDAAIGIVVFLAIVLGYSLLQGATGRTPGKAVFGIKVVDEQGGTPGFGKSILRTVLWVVDLAPWCIPGLVGFITGLTTKGHRRVGDMAAKTLVVGKDHTGPPQVPGLSTAAGGWPGGPGPGGYGQPGQPGQPWGGAPQAPTGPPTAWGGQPQGQPSGAWGTPPTGGPPSSPAAPTGPPGTPSGENRPAPPTGWTAPGTDAPSTGATAASAAAASDETVVAGPTEAKSPSGETPAASDEDSPASDETRPFSDETKPFSAGPESSAPGAPGTPGGAETAHAGPGATPSPSPAATEPSTPQPAAAQPATSQPAAGGYSPQWDAARGTYIVWEPNRGKWLGWDEAAQEWKPL